MNDLEITKFTNNKYYLEIIKGFISGYTSPRINISDNLINVKANDRVGSKEIEFTINDLDRLEIKVNRTSDLVRFQDIIFYDNQGIMMERINTQAELKKDANEKFQDRPNVLASELREIGYMPSIYTNQIFNSIHSRKIIRSDNFNLQGLYIEKDIHYDTNGLMHQKLVEGTFNVLKSNSISTLEFPKEDDLTITREDEFDDNDITTNYPNSRSL